MNNGRWLFRCASCIPLNLLACRRQKEMMPSNVKFSTRARSLRRCYKKRGRVFKALGKQYTNYNSDWVNGFYYGLLSASVAETNCTNWLWKCRVEGCMNTIERERKLP